MKLAPLSSFLLVALAASAANAEDLTVGEWIIPADGGPYPSMEANVGDTITFVWPATHSVQINPSGSCDFEGTVMIGDTSPTAYTFVEADGSPEGTPHLFVCGVGAGAHCEAGQELTVTVFSAGDAAPSDAAPSAAAPSEAAPSDAPDDMGGDTTDPPAPTGPQADPPAGPPMDGASQMGTAVTSVVAIAGLLAWMA